MKQEIKINSVYEITRQIRKTIESNDNLQNIWVRGEISNLKLHNNGCSYFTLKDEKSEIKCVVFNQEFNFEPKDGIKVVVRGRISVWKSCYQIVVEEINLEGRGELYFKFLQLKEKLQKEGLFEEKYKKSIPIYPKIIGIITSLEGAVIYDVIKIIKNKYPHIKILIYPSLVQGDEAKNSISRGIELLNSLTLDTIIIARGGGSFEDLFPFNEEIVARAIFNSRIPIISAIGHESDVTIADLTADKRASTPSVAAEISVPSEKDILKFFRDWETSLLIWVKNLMDRNNKLLKELSNRKIFRKPNTILETYDYKYSVVNNRLNDLSPYSVLNRGYSITMKKGEIISSVRDINGGDLLSTVVKDGTINSKVKNRDEKRNII
ncbi:MAG: exodeoxyribonuclease VII large subunit [Nanoarchaeota archaeon]